MLRFICAMLIAMIFVATVAAQEGTGSLSGTVMDASGGSLPNATVIIGGASTQTISGNAWGAFVITGVEPGRHHLRIQRAGFRPKEIEVVVEADKETSLGQLVLEVKVRPCVGNANQPRISEVKLQPGRTPQVTGRALDRGMGVEDVTIRLSPAGTSNLIAATTSDQKGDFWFIDVKPGVYYLEFSYGGSNITRGPKMRVRTGHAVEVLVTWQPWPPGELCL